MDKPGTPVLALDAGASITGPLVGDGSLTFHGLDPEGPLNLGAAQALSGSAFTGWAVSDPTIRFMDPPGPPIITFHADGRVTANPDLKPDEAAAKVIERIIAQWPAVVAQRQN